MKRGDAAARAAFDEYVLSEVERLDAFRRAVADRGGPAEDTLDLSRDSLGPLGSWFLEPPPPGPEDELRPSWAGDRAADDPWLRGAWLMDGLAAYVAAALRRIHPSVRWQLDLDRRSDYYARAVLTGIGPVETWPYAPVNIMLRRARQAVPPDPEWLTRMFDGWSALVTQQSGRAPLDAAAELDRELDDVRVTPVADGSDWSAELWLSEAAEQVLGTAAFEGLYDRLAAVPGIEGIDWEDRERFLLRIHPGTDLAAIRDAVRAELRAARRIPGPAEPGEGRER